MEKPLIPHYILLILSTTFLFYILFSVPPNTTIIILFLTLLAITIFSVVFIGIYLLQRKKLQTPKIAYKNSMKKAVFTSLFILTLALFRLTGNFEPIPITLLIVFVFLINRSLRS